MFEKGARLVTLTGPGGSGKTRLALEAAAALVSEYKAGVFWVGLAALRDPAFVAEAIAQTLGAKDDLAQHIGERQLLLLLDNLEQVIDAAPDLSALLRACPSLTLLVTSRELLRAEGEVEYTVPPLASPKPCRCSANAHRPSPTEEITELCVRLDNLPLAVELAAARTKVLSPAQILERLSQRLDLLKGGRDTDPRQQTLRATIEWSYDLLSEREQRLFRALSVFAGGCTLDAAEAVAEADLDTLQSLLEKSLLRFSNLRYWMLETIREFATERLAAADEEPELAESHAGHMASVFENPYTETTYDNSDLTRIQAELPNLRAALEHALTRRRAGPRPPTIRRCVLHLARAWTRVRRRRVGKTRHRDAGKGSPCPCERVGRGRRVRPRARPLRALGRAEAACDRRAPAVGRCRAPGCHLQRHGLRPRRARRGRRGAAACGGGNRDSPADRRPVRRRARGSRTR